jgi:hypothetical protein
MFINRLATFVAGSTVVAATLAGIATTTVAPANADGGTAIGAAYSAATGKWGFGTNQPNVESAYSAAKAACVGSGGTDCKVVGGAISGCAALIVAGDFATVGFGDTPATAATDALSIAAGGTIKDTQCSSAPAAPANVPKQGPTVSPQPGLTGVTFHITDRSGVASQCTYSSEGFETSFGLPANGSFDLDVPAIRLLKNRTGKVTCDNGTSTPTSVFY